MARQAQGEGAAALRVWLLGAFRVEAAGRAVADAAWRLRKAKSLVKLLALAPGHTLNHQQVTAILWPELEPVAAANNLQYALHTARRVLDPAWTRTSPHLPRQGDRLSLTRDLPIWTDVAAFAAAAELARAGADPAEAEAALAGYGGELLPEDRYEDWTTEPREALHQSHLGLLLHLAELHRRRGDARAAIAVMQQVLAIDPADEPAHVAVMRLYARAGERTLALRQYQQLQAALRRELDAEPAEATTRLHEAIQRGLYPPATDRREAPPPVPAAPEPAPLRRERHNLPHPLTSFIGRARELAEVAALLDAHRLVTLTGPGGCGKTRLALTIAAARLDACPDGCWLVDLAPVADPALVGPAVASALGVQDARGDAALDRLRQTLQSQRGMLILDNCEHLLDPVAMLADTLLRACPELRILATSQQSLGMLGEAVYPVPPLAVPPRTPGWSGGPARAGEALPEPHQVFPPTADAEPLAPVARSESVQLFLDRARLVRPDFALTRENADTVVAICRQLDGLPLAIELAAARIGVLPAGELASRIDDSLHLLTRGNRTALPRHRTLRGVVEWSYALLNAAERALFDRLSIFAGGFTLDAVAHIAGERPAAVLDRLVSLVDRSLVSRQEIGGTSRYRLLVTLRQFGRERLAERGETADTAHRHASHYVALAEAAAVALNGPEQVDWLARLDLEEDNLRAALAWAQPPAPPAALALGLRLGAALGPFWATRGHWHEGRRWLDSLLTAAATIDADAEPPLPLAQAQYAAGLLARRQGDQSDAEAHLHAGREAARRLGDPATEAACLGELALVASIRGQEAHALALAELALALSRPLGDRAALARGLELSGTVAFHARDYERAQTLLEEALALYRELEHKIGMAEMLSRLGVIASDRRDFARAAALYEQSLALRRELGNQPGVANSLHNLAVVLWYQGEMVRAAQLVEQSLRLAHHLGDQRLTLFLIFKMAILRLDAGDFSRAAQLGGAAEAMSEALQLPRNPLDRAVHAQTYARQEPAIDATAYAADWAIGRATPPAEAVALALDAVTTAVPSLAAEAAPRLLIVDRADHPDDEPPAPTPRRTAGRTRPSATPSSHSHGAG